MNIINGVICKLPLLDYSEREEQWCLCIPNPYALLMITQDWCGVSYSISISNILIYMRRLWPLERNHEMIYVSYCVTLFIWNWGYSVLDTHFIYVSCSVIVLLMIWHGIHCCFKTYWFLVWNKVLYDTKCYTSVGATSRIRTSHLLSPYIC